MFSPAESAAVIFAGTRDGYLLEGKTAKETLQSAANAAGERAMSVYVDDMEAPYGRMIMCHMIADTPEELRAMAEKIRVPQKWLQKAGTFREHFDVCKQKRCQAVMLGAIEITIQELSRKCTERKVRLAR